MDEETRNLLSGVLSGDVRSIARAMSKAESSKRQDREFFSTIFAKSGGAHTIGLTGVPGSGKSTIVQALTKVFRASGRTVGIVAVDPSSPFSGGAILGDRVRMGELAGDSGVFIRSMATRGSMGGLTRGCMEAVDILDAAGFDIILIETVGVGQDEVDIARAALSIIVVSAPGLGDDIQAIKAGVLEIADIHVVSKCDHNDSHQTVSDIKGMVGLGLSGRKRFGWQTPVAETAAKTGKGINALASLIDEHLKHLHKSGEWEIRQADIAKMRLLKAAEEVARQRITEASGPALDKAIEQLNLREKDPYAIAIDLVNNNK